MFIENMNKIPHMWKGIEIRTWFCTHKCEKGKIHEDKVRFDQVNNTAIGEVAHFGRQRSVNEEMDIFWGKP